jgi:hypothetical protein
LSCGGTATHVLSRELIQAKRDLHLAGAEPKFKMADTHHDDGEAGCKGRTRLLGRPIEFGHNDA